MDDKELHSLLFSAIRHHNESLLNDLVASDDGAKLIDTPGEDGNLLLHVAVMENDLRHVKRLLSYGADPNAFDANRARSPLHLAVELGQTDIVKAFLELEHVNLELRDDRNLTCCEIAQFCDNQKLADIINDRRDEIERIRNDFYSLMNQACTSNKPRLVNDILNKCEKRFIENLPEGWNAHKDKKLFAKSYIGQLINWSSSSWNDVTLLFKASSLGHTEVCKILIEYGATAKCNDNTNYSPLYVAAYGGFTTTVRLLLDNFPALVQEVTIEKWTVLHACCLQGHSDAAQLILNYRYPDSLKRRYVSRSGLYEYYFTFDLNAQDAAGQTVIYLAVSANNEQLLDTLLQFNVEAKLINSPASSRDSYRLADKTQQRALLINKDDKYAGSARLIQDKLGYIKQSKLPPTSHSDKMSSRLKNSNSIETKSDDASIKDENKYLMCPFEMDTYCDYNSKTALHLAVCQQYHSIATTLLVNGSNPNLPILSRDSIKNDFTNSNNELGLNWLRSSKSTCLKEACRLNDETMCGILIRYGASDHPDNLALQVASMNKNCRLISMFLSLKGNVDSEYKINKKCNVEFASRFKQNQQPTKITYSNTTTTFNSMFPSSPVTIDWQNLKCIKQIDPQWLINASLMHNKRLRHPTNSLMAITRLDLSSNNLKSVHPVIFRLPSLRELNLSKNRLETLLDINQRGLNEGDATSKLIESQRSAMKRSKSSNLSTVSLENSNMIDLNEPQEWDLPSLEILDLHDNLLISLPDCLFQLPKLKELDVSSNQLRQFPWALWTAPSLRELIATGNLLDDLPKVPTNPQSSRSSISSSGLTPISDSPVGEEGSSLTSNQSFDNSYANTISSCAGLESMRMPSNYLKNLRADSVTAPIKSIKATPLNHLSHWQKRIDLVKRYNINSNSNDQVDDKEPLAPISKISYLNLSHNSFINIPPVLACITTDLIRLNLSYNRLESLGEISLYPSKLKNLDLSSNHISTWFQASHQDCDTKHCYVENIRRPGFKLQQRAQVFCPHKLHQRLEGLKLLNLSHNSLTNIEIHYPLDNLNADSIHDGSLRIIGHNALSSAGPTCNSPKMRQQLLYPNVTTLDVSYNRINIVPGNMYELKDLSVLNLSGNPHLTTLPPELGLANKLWNLGVVGCHLTDPLKSIVESKTYKTMDIVGYLRSILEEAKPYARMKLMLVGLHGIGKTSLLEQMRHEGSTGSSRRRAPEHWTRRMGHSSRSNLRNQKGVTLSTVGVDIHDWIFCKRTPRNQPSFGPVTFSTWDFGGQDEFYATHRYFLSKRSIYLVVWRLTDGFEGIQTIQQWLVNIQSRASGSPVIIVGTHEDAIEGGERSELVQKLQAEVYSRFINVSDQDKCGLPRVMDSLVVSTKTKYNIKNLCNRIYDVVFSLRCPGSSERLLEQKIPATYLYLEEIISSIVHDRQQKKFEPVLTYEQYKRIASEQLKARHNKVFRDLEPIDSHDINYNSELQQATRFLHENGILLHYEDSNLRDLYFLDPQWLCDILSHVVTIREINPHVRNGLMKIDDLGHLFKSMEYVNLSGGIQSYVVNLLNKFEVALTWNSQYLLIPSLLPHSPEMIDKQQDFRVNVVPRMRGRSAVRRYEPSRGKGRRSTSIDPTRDINIGMDKQVQHQLKLMKNFYEFEFQPNRSMTRLILLRYLPDGFLARLQSGILSDPVFDDICSDLYWNLLEDVADVETTNLANLLIGSKAGWICWRNGIELSLQKESTINTRSTDQDELLSPCLLSVQEFSSASKNSQLLNKDLNFKVDSVQIGPNQGENVDIIGSKWCDLNVSSYSNIILITVPNPQLKIISKEDRSERRAPFNHQNIAKLLSRAVDHMDSLLEDWYPSLGARFAHTLGGNYLVTRIIPCRDCLEPLFDNIGFNNNGANDRRASRQQQRQQQDPSVAARGSSVKPKPGGGGKAGFTIVSAATGEIIQSTIANSTDHQVLHEVYCYYVEHCILNAYNLSMSSLGNQSGALNLRRISLDSNSTNDVFHDTKRFKARNLHCPKHGHITLSAIAPDIVFEDIPADLKISKDQIERYKLIGRGMLGFVFKGSLRSTFPLNQLAQANQEIALKLLQPVDPGPEAEQSDLITYKSALNNWHREPFQSACKSYCTARHEINILHSLHHPNIVSFIGVCFKPLALVLELAPLGSLTDVFKNYKRAGVRINQFSVQKTITQIARALEFLHQQRVIYRDLKTENVLVWSFPSPYATQMHRAVVELKLADYGISRQALSTGIWKGFAGTISFLAPEILRHNGDEEYTEKVDCFSFGMFIYELLTLRPPYKHGEGARIGHLTDGGRPTLTPDDIVYPCHMLDLMTFCWSQEPQDRPTASQIVSIAGTPEFMQILSAVNLHRLSSSPPPPQPPPPPVAHHYSPALINSFCAIQFEHQLKLWSGRQLSELNILSSDDQGLWTQRQQIEIASELSSSSLVEEDGSHVTSMCLVGNHIWLSDSNLSIHTLPLSAGSQISPQSAKDQAKGEQDSELRSTTATSFDYGDINLSDQLSLNQPTLMMNTNEATIQSFSPNNLRDAFARLPPRSSVSIKILLYVDSADCVIALLTNGQLWICHLDSLSTTIDFEKLELGGSMQFNCMVLGEESKLKLNSTNENKQHAFESLESVEESGQSFVVYCGHANGISSLEICNCEVRRQRILPLATATGKLAANDDSGVQNAGPNQEYSTDISAIATIDDLLWTSAGCTVHLWSIKQKHVVRKLDCWKLVPCSESLESINIEEYYQQARSSCVVSMVHSNGQLFVGTSHGCLIIIEADTLKPMVVFRPYESNLIILKPLVFNQTNFNCNKSNDQPSANTNDAQSTTAGQQNSIDNNDGRYLVAIGRGYRDLMKRYVNSMDHKTSAEQSLEYVAMVLAANKFNF